MTSRAAVYDDGVLRITWAGSPPVLALAGEIDESTYPGLLRALKAVAAEQRDVHVSLAEVNYCDLAGLRAIVLLTGADGPSHNGDGPLARRVILHEVPSRLQAVLRILGWDCVPGLTLDGVAPDGVALDGLTLDGQQAAPSPRLIEGPRLGCHPGGRDDSPGSVKAP